MPPTTDKQAGTSGIGRVILSTLWFRTAQAADHVSKRSFLSYLMGEDEAYY